jgi:SAM-dependent methyltransferase
LTAGSGLPIVAASARLGIRRIAGGTMGWDAMADLTSSEPGPAAAGPDITPLPRQLYDGCPLCGAALAHLRDDDCSRHPLYHPAIPRTMRWMQCQRCGHVCTDGYFTSEACDIIFSKTHDRQQPGYDFERQRLAWSRVVSRVANITSEGGWLDVGFGNGSLLFTAQEWGFAAVGLDLRPSSVDTIRQLGVEAYCVDLVEFQPGRPFSVISMADVLEHMPYPLTGLMAARQLMSPGGALFLSMPSFNCPVWRFLDALKSNGYWSELEHYHNFSRARLYDLLREAGFKPVSYDVSDRYPVCMEVIAVPV